MRISDQMMYQNMAQNIDQAQASYVRTQQEASSGVSISQPSDNPEGTAVVLQLQAAQQQVKAWQGNANTAQSQMQVADQSLGQIQNLVSTAMSLATQASGASVTTQDMQNMSDQAGGILSQMASLLDTQYGSQYVFSGVAQTPPVTNPSAGVYSPSSEQTGGVTPQTVEIGNGVKVPISADASSVTGGPKYMAGTQLSTMPQWAQNWATAHAAVSTGSPATTTTQISLSLTDVLTDLQGDLQGGNAAAVEADLGALQAQSGSLASVRAALGANMNRVQAALSQLQTMGTTLQTQQGGVENVDMAQIVAQLSAQQTSYQAAVAAGAQMKLPTLANYLT